MAVTKIWAVTDSISRVIRYAANPEKTEFSDIKKTLHYIGNQEKTVMENEKTIYVTGVNCTAETAFQEMISVQEPLIKLPGTWRITLIRALKPVRSHRNLRIS